MQLLRGQQPSGRLGSSEQAPLVQFMTQLQAAGTGAHGGVHPAFPWPQPQASGGHTLLYSKSSTISTCTFK